MFGVALKANTSGIIVAHNHPSGNLTPSANDRELTAEMKAVGKLLDHLILTKDDYFSFSDQRIL